MKSLKKNILSGALAGVMAMSLAVPAFAATTTPAQDPNSTVVTGQYQSVTISVTVTPTASAFINPYGLDVDVKADNADTSSTPATVTISGQQIVTTPMSLQNQTAMDLSVSATMVGEVDDASDMRLATAPLAAGDTSKNAFVYLQAAQEPTLTGAFTSITAANIATKYAAWAASEYNADADLVLGTREATKTGIVTLAAADTSGSAPEAEAGSIALYRLAGQVVASPRGDGWAATDKFTANIAFTFAPAAKYTVTLGTATFAAPATGAATLADVAPVTAGSTVTLSITADNNADTVTVTVKKADGTTLVTGDAVAGSGKARTYTFTMPEENVTVDLASK